VHPQEPARRLYRHSTGVLPRSPVAAFALASSTALISTARAVSLVRDATEAAAIAFFPADHTFTVLYCPVLSYPVLSCSCPLLSCPVLSCPVCPALSVLYCPVCLSVLSCTVLSCLYCLSCTATVCTVLSVLHCLYCPVLYCTVLYCTVLSCACPVLYCPACTLLSYTVLYCTVLTSIDEHRGRCRSSRGRPCSRQQGQQPSHSE